MHFSSKRLRLAAFTQLAFCLLFFLSIGFVAKAESVVPLNSFSSPNGSYPIGGKLILGADGYFYGTTEGGTDGTGYGTIFKADTSGNIATLYYFDYTTGGSPEAGLLLASDGNFYGTTYYGGANNYGTIFKMTPAGQVTALYSFDKTNGASPLGGLIEGADGYLYGTTSVGGASNLGVIYRISKAGVYTKIKSFIGSNGAYPYGNLVQGKDGYLYGTTSEGGASGYGSVFKMSTGGATFLTLGSFNGTTTGAYSYAGLLIAADGKLYGTTYGGGTNNYGVVFSLTTSGSLSTLYSFDSTNGRYPSAALIQGVDGNLYGTTPEGGTGDAGTVFSISTAGSYTLLYSFSGADGNYPDAPLVQGPDGYLYGTTYVGGDNDLGTFFLAVPLYPTNPAFNNAAFVSQTIPSTMMIVGSSQNVSIAMLNTGTTPWMVASNYRLASQNPAENTSFGGNSIYPTSIIMPGKNAIFNFAITAPLTPGNYNFQWGMSQDDVGYFGALTPNVPLLVVTNGVSSALSSQTPPVDTQFAQQQNVSITIMNTGNVTWTTDNYSLIPADGTNTWGVTSVPLPYSVAPGQTVTFNFTATAPTASGSYNFQWQMAQNGQAFGTPTTNVVVNVSAPPDFAEFVSQSIPNTIIGGQTYSVSVTMKNTGTNTWTSDSYSLIPFSNAIASTWNVSPVSVPASVAPGNTATFNFNITAPFAAGPYSFQWVMAQNNAQFGLTSPNIALTVTQPPGDSAAFISQSVPATMTAGQSSNVSVTMRNMGTNTWAPGSYSLVTVDGSNIWGVTSVAIPNNVATGDSVTINFAVAPPTTPSTSGTYNFQWQLSDAGQTFGPQTPNTSISVTPPGNFAYFVSQSIPDTIVGGQTYTVSVTMLNMGTNTWTSDNAYSLIPLNDTIKSTWSVTPVSVPSSVAPGQMATFTFNITAPLTPGSYDFQWSMAQNSTGFGVVSSSTLTVAQPLPDASAYIAQSLPSTMVAGQTYNVSVTMRNMGTNTWTPGNYVLVPADGLGTWGVTSVALPNTVATGDSVTFNFPVTPPTNPATSGNYNFQWKMADLGQAFGSQSTLSVVSVTPPPDFAYFVNQSIPNTIVGGLTYNVSVTMKNTGTNTWSTGYSLIPFNDSVKSNWNVTSVPLTSSVAPGASTIFNFTITAPFAPSAYNFQWIMANAGQAFGNPTTATSLNVSSAPANSAAFISQSVPSTMIAGQSYTVTVTMRNMGTNTWSDASKYRLGSQAAQDNIRWGFNRVKLTGTASQGDLATFTFTVTAPATAGNYDFQWRMVQDGVAWFGPQAPDVLVPVKVVSDAALFVSQQVPATMYAGRKYSVSMTMKNVGLNTWTIASNYRLGSQNPQDNKGWGSARAYLPGSVSPGSTVTIPITITAPATPGSYNFQWRMVHESVAWFGDLTKNMQINVLPAPNDAAFVSQSVPTSMIPGQTYNVSVTMQNVGTTTWTPDQSYRLGSQNLASNTTWGKARVYLPIGTSVAPGGSYTFNFTVKAPATNGNYNFQWQMVQDGVEWFGALPSNVVVNVAGLPKNAASFVSQSVPATMTAGQTYNVSVTMLNTGTATWTPDTSYRLGSQNLASNTTWGKARVYLPAGTSVPSGSSYTFNFTVKAPATPGNYNFQWQMVQEGVQWFGDLTPNQVITIQ